MPKVDISNVYCKSCGLCVAICPQKVLEIGDKANAKGYYTAVVRRGEKCIGCALCGMVCPDVAIEVSK